MASSGLPATYALPRITAGVIADARRHRRRRRAIVGAVMAATLAAGVIALVVVGRAQRQRVPSPAHGSAMTVAPSTVLADQPWIGLACPAPVPFSAARAIAIARACNRVGLMIDLRTPAVTATATIDGQTFKLDDRAESSPPLRGGTRTSLAGFPAPAGFLHGPFKVVTFRNGIRQRFTVEHLHLVIDYSGGQELQTTVQELGYGGWG